MAYGKSQFGAEQLRPATDGMKSLDAGPAQELIDEALRVSKGTSSVLDQLLVQRIDGFENDRNRLLLVALAGLAGAVYLIISFYLAYRHGFGSLISRMRKLANGDLTLNQRSTTCAPRPEPT